MPTIWSALCQDLTLSIFNSKLYLIVFEITSAIIWQVICYSYRCNERYQQTAIFDRTEHCAMSVIGLLTVQRNEPVVSIKNNISIPKHKATAYFFRHIFTVPMYWLKEKVRSARNPFIYETA